MSQILILKNKLAAPQILSDLLVKLAQKNPTAADWIEGLETVPLIEECAVDALKKLVENNSDIELSDTITSAGSGTARGDFHNKKILGVLKSKKLDHGIGVLMDTDGTISFAMDDYITSWEVEGERLEKLFKGYFLLEAKLTFLDLAGFDTNFEIKTITDPETNKTRQVAYLEGVKE